MSLDKSIKHKKEYRKQYRDIRSCDRTCRHQGGCAYCEEGRQVNAKRRKSAADYQVKEYEE